MTGDGGAGDDVTITGLTARYGDVLALDDVTLTVPAGRICGLLGTNGSGKSTLLKAVLGLVPASAGAVQIAGATPAAARRRGAVAYVPQADQVDVSFPLDVRAVVEQGRYGRLGPLRRLRASDHDAVAHALHRVGLADLADRPIAALSGGQRKRAFVARALAQGAEVLLLDEPFGGVDAPSQATMTAVLRELADAGACVIVATHDLVGLSALADEAALLAAGRLVVHGSPEHVLKPVNLARAFGVAPGGDGDGDGAASSDEDAAPSDDNGSAP